MAEPPSDLGSNDDRGVEPDRGSTRSAAWVLYVPLSIIGLIVLGAVVLHLTGHALTGH
jgi:hypothetical protein